MGNSCHIHKGDTVKVITGKDAGKTGRVLKVFPAVRRAIIENINFMKHHVRANPSKNVKGGVMEKEGSMDLSNLQVVCPECGKPTRVGKKALDDGSKVRVCRKCSGVLDRE